MFSFLKTLDFWLIVAVVISLSGGMYLIGFGHGTDKGMEKIARWKDEQSKAITEAMQREHQRQMMYIEEREPIIQKEIHYLDRVVTQYEEIIKNSPDRCVMSPDRVRGYNAIGQTPAD